MQTEPGFPKGLFPFWNLPGISLLHSLWESVVRHCPLFFWNLFALPPLETVSIIVASE